MNRENTRRVVPVETTTSNALISCDGLGDYDWSNQAKEGPTNFSLMTYSSTSSNSEVSTDSNCSSSCLENFKILKEQNEQLMSLDYERMIYKDIKLLKCEIYLKEVSITELRRKLELAQKQKDEIQLTVENFENSSKNLNKLLDCQIVDKCKTSLGYNAVPPPYTGNFMPPKHDFSFSGIEEFVNEPIVSEPTNNGAPIIKDWVPDSKEEDVPQAKKEKKIVKSSFAKIKFVKSKEQVKSPRKKTVKQGNPQMDFTRQGVIDSGCSRHMTGNMSYFTNFKEIDEGYVAFGGNPKRGKITGRDHDSPKDSTQNFTGKFDSYGKRRIKTQSIKAMEVSQFAGASLR
ncbi:hypothetical protein Tco_0563206 [Tanacetum coccineum]